MNSLRLFAIVAIVSAFLCGALDLWPFNQIITGSSCNTEADCSYEEHCCDDGWCHECCEDKDCYDDDVCSTSFTCVDSPHTVPYLRDEDDDETDECTDDADCEELCGTSGCVCTDGECVEAEPGCTEDADCDLLGEGLQCVDGQCVPQEPTPEPECTEDAVVTFVVSGEPGQEFWAAEHPRKEGPKPTWDEEKERLCKDPAAFEDLHSWNLIPFTAGPDGIGKFTIPENSSLSEHTYTVLGRSLGDDRSPSGICAIMATDFHEVTPEMQCLGAEIQGGRVQAVFECIPGCSELH